ncbi:MAG: ATP-binding protein [Porcipelethomonas sp.]
MIKRLKRRFIIVNMSILTCVLLAILSSVFVLMYNSEVNVSYQFMESVLYQKEIRDPNRMDDNEIQNMNSVDSGIIVPLTFDFQDDNMYDDYYDDRYPDDFVPDIKNPPFDENGDKWNPPFEDENGNIWPPSYEEPPTEGRENESKPDDSDSMDSTESIKEEQNHIRPTDENSKPSNEKPDDSYGSEEKNPNNQSEETQKQETTISSSKSEKNTEATVTSQVVTKPALPEKKDKPDPYMGNVKRTHIYVRFRTPDDIEEILYRYCNTEDDSAVSEAVHIISEGKKERGKISINNQKFRYLLNKSIPFDDYELVLLDRTLEISTVNRLLFIFIIIGGLGMVFAFGISVLLANWTIKPVDRAWNQQKQFVADASHELKTPLTVISANTDVILSSPDDLVKNQTKWLNYIKSETVRMSKLVNNMLYIAKYDTNHANVEIQTFNLSNMLTSTCLQFENIIFENGKTLETNINNGISIQGDEDKIKQLITILLDNSVKYSTESGKISVSLTSEKGKACIEVSNSSEPISSDQLSKIFDRFYRVDDSRNSKTGGSGLGLNIAKTIVEAHHGSISAKYRNGVISFIIII